MQCIDESHKKTVQVARGESNVVKSDRSYWGLVRYKQMWKEGGEKGREEKEGSTKKKKFKQNQRTKRYLASATLSKVNWLMIIISCP